MRPTLLLILLLTGVCAIAQDGLTEESRVESVAIKKTKKSPLSKSGKPHTAKRAVLYSLALPGLGQIYNRHYWKVPIIYGGLAGMTYLLVTNKREFRNYQAAFIMQADDDPLTAGSYKGITNSSTLQSQKNGFRRNLEFSAIGFMLVYGINLIDAAVFGHLFDFDVNEEISMRFSPSLQLDARLQPAYGMRMQIKL